MGFSCEWQFGTWSLNDGYENRCSSFSVLYRLGRIHAGSGRVEILHAWILRAGSTDLQYGLHHTATIRPGATQSPGARPVAGEAPMSRQHDRKIDLNIGFVGPE